MIFNRLMLVILLNLMILTITSNSQIITFFAYDVAGKSITLDSVVIKNLTKDYTKKIITSSCELDFITNINNIDPPQSNNFLSYPNPFENLTNINISIHNSDYYTIKLYDLLGNEYYRNLYYLEIGEHNFLFNGSGLNHGLYILCFQSIETKQFVKLVKQGISSSSKIEIIELGNSITKILKVDDNDEFILTGYSSGYQSCSIFINKNNISALLNNKFEFTLSKLKLFQFDNVDFSIGDISVKESYMIIDPYSDDKIGTQYRDYKFSHGISNTILSYDEQYLGEALSIYFLDCYDMSNDNNIIDFCYKYFHQIEQDNGTDIGTSKIARIEFDSTANIIKNFEFCYFYNDISGGYDNMRQSYVKASYSFAFDNLPYEINSNNELVVYIKGKTISNYLNKIKYSSESCTQVSFSKFSYYYSDFLEYILNDNSELRIVLKP